MSITATGRAFFTDRLLQWHFGENNRQLPWKNEKDPYKIWLSEIILQQTRAEQGLPYYERFIAAYPDVHALAAAPEDEVFRLWQGLGYYNRCRNLLATARTISNDHKGQFPSQYETILGLKGIGAYTAAAIASFAFNLPYAVVDGNVYRVLSRFFGIDKPVDSTEGKKYFQELASSLLDTSQPAAYNQAIMDFGASVCKPQLPLCSGCPLSTRCVAYRKDLVGLLPVKEKRMLVKHRHFHYFVLMTDDEVFIRQRTEKDIWQNLYEFFLIENEGDITAHPAWQSLAPLLDAPPEASFENRQRLTHQLIISGFYLVHLQAKTWHSPDGIWVAKDSLKNYAFPKTILSFFSRKKYF